MVEGLECHYPGCKQKEIWGSHPLRLTNEVDASVELPFCKYHFFIIIGGFFNANKAGEEDNPTFVINGPFKEIEIAEQVLAAREVVNTKK